jgi:hypothetical protein
LRQEDKGFMSKSDGASLRSSVPYWPFAPRRSTLFSSTGFYTQTNRRRPDLKEGKNLIRAEYRGKRFYIKVNAVAPKGERHRTQKPDKLCYKGPYFTLLPPRSVVLIPGVRPSIPVYSAPPTAV